MDESRSRVFLLINDRSSTARVAVNFLQNFFLQPLEIKANSPIIIFKLIARASQLPPITAFLLL